MLPAHMKDAGELERGIFSIEVEFHTFSEMIFHFFFLSSHPPQLFLVFLNQIEHELSTLDALLKGRFLCPLWTPTPSIWQNKREIT